MSVIFTKVSDRATHCHPVHQRLANLTCLQGYIHTTFAQIVAAYGQPNSDGAYVDNIREWTIMTPAGVATIYAYKPYGQAYHQIFTWNIGGFNPNVIRWVEADVVSHLRTQPAAV